MVHKMLFATFNISYFYISTCRSMCAVANIAVFCSSLIWYLPGVLLRYFLNDFEMVPVVPVIIGIIFAFTFHMCCLSIKRSSYAYFQTLSASFFITFLSPEIPTSINTHLPFSFSRIMMSAVLLGMVLSVCPCWFHNMFTWPSTLASTDFGTCSCQCSLSHFIRIFLQMLELLSTHSDVSHHYYWYL
jgi:hypothetical protein